MSRRWREISVSLPSLLWLTLLFLIPTVLVLAMVKLRTAMAACA